MPNGAGDACISPTRTTAHSFGWLLLHQHTIFSHAAAGALLLQLLYPCCSLPRAGLSGAGLTDFADDVADLVASSTAAEGGRASGLNDLFGKHKLSQKYGADLGLEQQAQVRRLGKGGVQGVVRMHAWLLV